MKASHQQRGIWLQRVFLVLCTLASIVHADVYRWTDEHGHIHFGDKPPAGTTTEQVEIRINTYTSPQIVSRPAERRAKVEGRKPVVMYSASWCGVCKRAMAYFKAKDIPYQDYDVENSAKGRADFKRLGGRGVPIILVGDARMNGYSPAHFERLYYH